MLMGMKPIPAKAIMAAVLVALVLAALVLGNLRRDSKPAAEAPGTGPAAALETPGTELAPEPTIAPTVVPEPAVEPRPDSEDVGGDDVNVAAITRAAKPAATAFLSQFFTYSYRNVDILERITPYATDALVGSFHEDLERDSAAIKEAVAKKQDGRGTVTRIGYDSWEEDGAIKVTFLATVKVDNRIDGGPWRPAFTSDSKVTVSKTKTGWCVSGMAVQE